MIHLWRTDETDPAGLGESFGSTWRPQVRATLTEYDRLFADRGVDPALVQRLAEDSRSAVAEHAPTLLAEIDGVARGAGIEPWQAMALNARTEILARAAVVVEECSTAVLVPADGGTPRTVQTWDWYSQMAAETVVRSLPTADGEARVVVFGEFGQVAKIGVSSRGVGVHLNILQHATDGDRIGVPVHVVARMILDRARTLAEAQEIVASVPLGASTVLTVVTAEPAAAAIELSPAGWAAIPAVPGTTLTHTNHFLDPDLAAGGVVKELATTYERLAFLDEHQAAVAEVEPLDRVRALASDAAGSVCVDPDPRRAPHDRPETKATFTIDVERGELGFAESHPLRIDADGWRTLSAGRTDG